MRDGVAEGLKKFKQWLDDYSFADTVKAKLNKGKTKAKKNEIVSLVDGEEDQADKDQRLLDEFTETHENARSKWKVNPNFPDQRVIDAYLKPEANRNIGEFEWTVPKLHRIRGYCRETIGWTDQEMDARIDPVIRKFAEKSIQTRIDGYFLMKYDDNKRAAKIKSKRLAKQTGLIASPTKSPKSSNNSPKKSSNNSSPKKSNNNTPTKSKTKK